jgi:hypothetical protein
MKRWLRIALVSLAVVTAYVVLDDTLRHAPRYHADTE